MRIGVISDTHARSLENIPSQVKARMEEVDLIVHAGDFTEAKVVEGLRGFGDMRAVAGNMDSPEVKEMLPSWDIFEANGKRIGVTHGSGGPYDLHERVRQMFDDVDIIIFGHSHMPFNEVLDGCLLFNPGRAMKSYGILTIEEEVKSEIIKI
ncbi:MAG: metallophosphoesterase family protein [Dehalococcoidia bacterium]